MKVSSLTLRTDRADARMVRTLLFGLAAVAALATAPAHAAGPLAPPEVPANLEVPEGHRPYLVSQAVGTQNYVCLPRTSAPGLAWTFHGPQATGFDSRDEQQLTHYLSPNPDEDGTARATWQHSRDSSAIWAKAIASSTDPEYVEPGAVAWLLLEIVGTDDGPDGGDRLSSTTYIQRVHTSGGSAPATDCPAVGAKLFVPYETDYVFYRASGHH